MNVKQKLLVIPFHRQTFIFLVKKPTLTIYFRKRYQRSTNQCETRNTIAKGRLVNTSCTICKYVGGNHVLYTPTLYKYVHTPTTTFYQDVRIHNTLSVTYQMCKLVDELLFLHAIYCFAIV